MVINNMHDIYISKIFLHVSMYARKLNKDVEKFLHTSPNQEMEDVYTHKIRMHKAGIQYKYDFKGTYKFFLVQ